ncbi:hypothetical protein [Candidatus Methylomirabilis sp.]|uniref:hypothetical protein n=1 Tax=Candidatus Methylomirabilis sp. TaxID=2032687 RepID=UPI002A6551DE|nr:hypothetical protein [Candidatus Methylomirabilis sp.]
MDPTINAKWLADLTRFIQHFPLRAPDMSLIVLKGHLLTEELLREFLRSKVKHPSYLTEARLTYIQCLHVARALSMLPEDWVWDAAARLNVIRNKLSHALEPDGLDVAIEEFIAIVQRHSPGQPTKELREIFTPLGVAIFGVHAALSAQLRVKPPSLFDLFTESPNSPVQPTTAEDSGG